MSTASVARHCETNWPSFPPAVLDAYQEATPALEAAFGEEEVSLWAKEGLTIGSQTVRSWESAVEYYKVGPQVARFLSFPSFMQWARCGTYLAQDSPTLAVAFFRASESIVPNLRPQYIPRWAGLGRSLYKGTWKSSTLAARFFEVSPDLVRSLPFWDVEVFTSLIEAMSYKSYDAAGECLLLGRGRAARDGEGARSLPVHVPGLDRRQLERCQDLLGDVAQGLTASRGGPDRPVFSSWEKRLAKSGMRDTSRFLSEGSQALSAAPQGSQGHILDLCESLQAVSPEAVPSFLKSLSGVLNRITVNQLGRVVPVWSRVV